MSNNKDSILSKSFDKAINGGLAGASAMVVQVSTLMWLRTTMNYQYRHGISMKDTFTKLYKEGGVRRFYRGLAPALIQGPVSRFGDTAINTGVLHYCNNTEDLRELPIFIKTGIASFGAAGYRIFTMPVDTCKTILQVEGKNGLFVLKNKINKGGVPVLYHGAMGSIGATYVGHFPWFATYNYLNEYLPNYDTPIKSYARNGLIGFSASIISDTCSNSIRVVKTYKQTSAQSISYTNIVKTIIKNDGLQSLFTRGLETRILANGLQGLLFSVLWKYFQNNHF
jgi:hypothetical protein